MVNIKFDDQDHFVFVYTNIRGNSIFVLLFGDLDMAKSYGKHVWGIDEVDWETYLSDKDGDCGWKYQRNYYESFHIHKERIVVEF